MFGLLLLSLVAFSLASGSAKISAELPHYYCLLAVREGVLGPTAPGMGAKLDQRGAKLTRTVPVSNLSSGLAR